MEQSHVVQTRNKSEQPTSKSKTYRTTHDRHYGMNSTNLTTSGNTWLFDSGCCIQMTPCTDGFVSKQPSQTFSSVSRNGNTILTSGRDNLHNLFDTRTLEVWGTLRASGNRVASNWSRSCISADDNYVAAGSVDGSGHVWAISNGNIVSNLKEHTGSVLCCSWSGLGKPLATSDKNGVICMWT